MVDSIEDVDDIVGEVTYTDSLKSIPLETCISEVIDTSFEKNCSMSGKGTYVLDIDDSDDSDPFSLDCSSSAINISEKHYPKILCKTESTQLNYGSNIDPRTVSIQKKCSKVAQESFTQTSKTIFAMSQADLATGRCINSLETQTSFICITENTTVEYKIEYTQTSHNGTFVHPDEARMHIDCNRLGNNSLEDGSSKFPVSESENRVEDSTDCSSNDDLIQLVEEDCLEMMTTSDESVAPYDGKDYGEPDASETTDFEEDSLMEFKPVPAISYDNKSECSEVPQSIDNEVEELYNKLNQEHFDIISHDKPTETYVQNMRVLTPLSEESLVKPSIIDITPKGTNNLTIEPNFRHTDNFEFKVNILPENSGKEGVEPFRLPPIKHSSYSNSPNLNLMFKICAGNQPNESGTVPCSFETQTQGSSRWEMAHYELSTSGEGDSSKNDKPQKEEIHLPPILGGESRRPKCNRKLLSVASNGSRGSSITSESPSLAISITDRIQELKCSTESWASSRKFRSSSSTQRPLSPSSINSAGGSERHNAVDRCAEALCQDLLKRLRSSAWLEVSETLHELPKALHKFWNVISEQRIADLIRQVSVHVDSPRTQVARRACSTLASVMINTNYTKKPDFYEAVTTLLIKTGSFSRPVRRAANVALDEIVCSVELYHAVTALCIHGTMHKSPLVRCAAARLLVVSCAVSGGGRELLRSRPTTSAAARRLALQALAALLHDKNSDTRKYAERLYAMLRPLPNFEAYYLTDATVEVASQQMKKYDPLLFCNEGLDGR